MQLTIEVSDDAILFNNQQEFDKWKHENFDSGDHLNTPDCFPCYGEYLTEYDNIYAGWNYAIAYYYPVLNEITE